MTSQIRTKRQCTIHISGIAFAIIENNRMLNETFSDCIDRMIINHLALNNNSLQKSNKNDLKPDLEYLKINENINNLENNFIKIIQSLIDNNNEFNISLNTNNQALKDEIKRNTEITKEYTEVLKKFMQYNKDFCKYIENIVRQNKS